MKYFYELYTPLPRGGPGNNACTRKAFSLIKGLPVNPKVLDVGCGPGMQTLELARLTKGTVVALDNHQPFLDKLARDAGAAGLDRYIQTANQDMGAMDLPLASFDLIWSEGALYLVGFENSLKNCRKLLKPGGFLAASELVWLKEDPTPEAKTWCQDYQDMKNVAANLKLFAGNGYEMIGHFTLPVSAWLEDYYAPLLKRIAELRPQWAGNEAATAVLDASQAEADGFKEVSDYLGYEFFVARASS